MKEVEVSWRGVGQWLGGGGLVEAEMVLDEGELGWVGFCWAYPITYWLLVWLKLELSEILSGHGDDRLAILVKEVGSLCRKQDLFKAL